MSTDATAPRPGLTRSLASSVLPAYLFPASTAFPSALLLGDERLAVAAFTTISIPAAIAATVVTLCYQVMVREPRPGSGPGRLVPAILGGATGSAAMVAAGCAVLVGNGWFDVSLFQDAVPSAAIAGGFTSAFSVRARNRRRRALEAGPQQAAAVA